MSYDFETTTYAKWILAGEHAVLRGHPALVFPLKNKTLTLRYTASNTPLHIIEDGEETGACAKALTELLQAGLKTLKKPIDCIQGTLYVTNHIPVRAGLGTSAALSTALARFLKAYVDTSLDVFQFAHELEHLFHGKSSGLDVAGTSATNGMYFKSGKATPLNLAWQPHFCLSYSGEKGVTSTCIERVNALWESNQAKAKHVDKEMARSVHMAEEALNNPNQIAELAHAIKLASNCFESWGLIDSPLQKHMNTLYDAGALAAKPTGSGIGGYVLSLWDKTPPNVHGRID